MKTDFGVVIGDIKKVNGVGQPPITGIDPDMFHYLKEANIPFSRLHDVGGTFGGGRFVDIPNIFPNFDADENDPANYFFFYTDWLIKALYENDVEPVYRLGVTIEGMVYNGYASPRIDPPKDYDKWARICEHIIRHYNEGWANGYHFGIRYWEIWNEADNHCIKEGNAMWQGTAEDYFRLYEVTSRHLKKCFPDIRIGGPASCGFWAITSPEPTEREQYFHDFFVDFLKWISSEEHKSPLDFCSYHSYETIERTKVHTQYCRKLLDQYGFADTETQLNEWNPSPRVFGLMKHAAYVAGMLLMFQNNPVDTACFYDARVGISEYGSLFSPETRLPYADYDAFVMFGRLLKLGKQVKLESEELPGVYAVAATDGGHGGIMLVNTNENGVELDLDIKGLPLDGMTAEVTDAGHRMAKQKVSGKLTLGAETMMYITV